MGDPGVRSTARTRRPPDTRQQNGRNAAVPRQALYDLFLFYCQNGARSGLGMRRQESTFISTREFCVDPRPDNDTREAERLNAIR